MDLKSLKSKVGRRKEMEEARKRLRWALDDEMQEVVHIKYYEGGCTVLPKFVPPSVHFLSSRLVASPVPRFDAGIYPDYCTPGDNTIRHTREGGYPVNT